MFVRHRSMVRGTLSTSASGHVETTFCNCPVKGRRHKGFDNLEKPELCNSEGTTPSLIFFLNS